MTALHTGGTTSYIKDYSASWERLFILMEDGNFFEANTPKQMWSTTLQGWVTYCPADANSELSMCLGSEVCINLFNRIIEIRLTNGKLFAAYTTREDL